MMIGQANKWDREAVREKGEKEIKYKVGKGRELHQFFHHL
jgi:hypothetical protein